MRTITWETCSHTIHWVFRGILLQLYYHSLKYAYTWVSFMSLIPDPFSFSRASQKLPQRRLHHRKLRKTQFLHSWNKNLGSVIFSLWILFLSFPPTCFVKGTKKTPSLKIQTDIVLPKSTRSYAGSLQTHTNSIKQSKQQLITTPEGSDQVMLWRSGTAEVKSVGLGDYHLWSFWFSYCSQAKKL